MAKKKRQGHYCRICGEWKANEKFSGKGHAAHSCRECAALPLSRRNELQRIGRVAAIDAKLRLMKEEWDLLEKYAQNTSYPELKKYAAGVLAHKREMRELRSPAIEVINYSDLDDERKEEIAELLYHDLDFFFEEMDAAPTDRQLKRMADDVLNSYITHFHWRIAPDEGWKQKCREVLATVKDEWTGPELSADEL
jgi:hypothetical protein